MVDKELVAWLVKHAKATEWETRWAAENQQCPYCANGDDAYRDQKEHHPGCEYVAMMAKIEAAGVE